MENNTTQKSFDNRETVRHSKGTTQAGLVSHLIGRLSICHDQHDHIELVTELYELDVLTEKAA